MILIMQLTVLAVDLLQDEHSFSDLFPRLLRDSPFPLLLFS